MEDDDPLDNRVSLMYTIMPNDAQGAASPWIPASDLAYFDMEQQRLVTVYPGDWSFELALPQRDIGWTMEVDQVAGELDGGTMSLEDKIQLDRLTQITDPARFQSGTLILAWDFTHDPQGSGSVIIPLDGLAPVAP